MKKRLLIALFSAAVMSAGVANVRAEEPAKAEKTAEKAAEKAVAAEEKAAAKKAESEGAAWDAKKAEGAAKDAAEKAAPAGEARRVGQRGGMGAAAFWKNEELAKKLNLTDEQKTKLEAAMKTYQEKTNGLAEKIRAAREAKDDAKSTELRTEQRTAIDAHRKGVTAILTEEQNKTLTEAQAAGRQRPGGQAGERPARPRAANPDAPKAPEAPKDVPAEPTSDGMN